MEKEDTAVASASGGPDDPDQLTVLIVDPDRECRRGVIAFADESCPRVDVAGVGGMEAAMASLENRPVDCVVSEYDLADGTCIDLQARLDEAAIDVPVVVFTSRDPAEVSRSVFRAGAADFVQKRDGGPYDFLFDKVQGAVERSLAGAGGSGERSGEPPASPQLVTLVDDAGRVEWQWGNLPDVGEETPLEDVATTLLEGERFREALGRAAAEDAPAAWVWPRADDGAIEHRGAPLPAAADRARLSVFRDVSEERRLRTEHETFQRLLDTARDGLYTLDQNGYYQYVNKSMADQLGYDREELIGTHAGRILAGDSYTEGQQRVQALVEDEERESEVLELTVRRKTGEEMPVAIHFAPLYGDDDSYDGLVGVMRDITERKEREDRLRESRRRYRTLAENLPNGAVAMFDETLTYTLVEGELFDSLDYDVDDFEGQAIDAVHDDAYVDEHLATYEAVFEGQRTEFELTHRGRIFRTHLVPIRDGTGNITAGLALILDVTEQREHEQELERQNQRLNEFASIVSHDLRNPLNVITGNLELYRETGDEERLDTVEANVERMETLIEELLELARGGRKVGETATVSLDDLVADCWAGIETASATLEREAPLGSVQADETRLVQLLENLFRNAVEHGGEDVTVTVGPLPRGFYVEDDGEGLPPDLGEEVFEYGVTRSETGTGIGLAIVQEVASAHGWTVEVGEAEGGGARFEIVGTRYAGESGGS